MNTKNISKNICVICNEYNCLEEKFKYNKPDNSDKQKFFDNTKTKILSCSECKISYCANINKKKLDDFYNYIYKNKKYIPNRFSEFNSRFFSQALYFINHCKLESDIKLLEIGPNVQGVLPTLKVFQENIHYFYYDQKDIQHTKKNIYKLGTYFDPNINELPNIDLIWMSHTLEHIYPEDLIIMLKAFYKALNPKGKIFIEIPFDIHRNIFNFPHLIFFERFGLEKLFKALNFKIISISYINTDKSSKNGFKKTFETNIRKNNKSEKMNLLKSMYLIFQKFLPDKFVKKYALKNFVKNGPSTELPIIRMIVEK